MTPKHSDSGAKKGSELQLIEKIDLPRTEINNKIAEHFYKTWEEEWKNYNKARMTKQFYTKPDPNQAKYVLKLGHLELSRFLKIITGQNGLFYFKNKVDKDINAVCRFCLERDETFYHLVTDCPVHRLARTNIFLDNIPETFRLPLYGMEPRWHRICPFAHSF